MVDVNYSKIKEGLYKVDKKFGVWSNTSQKFMKYTLDKDGYPSLRLRNTNNSYSNFSFHRLIMIAYNPIRGMESKQVNHIDGNKLNWSLDNLEWVTPLENIQHAKKTGLNECFGEKHGRALFTEEDIKEVLNSILKKKFSAKDIQIKFGLTKSNFYNIKNYKTWKTIGTPEERTKIKEIKLPKKSSTTILKESAV